MWDRYDNGTGYMHDGMGWGGWVLMTVLFLLLVAVLVVALLALMGRFPGSRAGGPGGPGNPGGPSDAEQLLDRRFAAGEIDEEEYRHRRSILHGG